jgi:S1-C subfamily serine protease
LGISGNLQGVMISDLDANSPAAQALQQGDVIESINRQPVRSVADFNRLAAQAQGDTLLRINRQGQSFFIVLSGDSGGDDH